MCQSLSFLPCVPTDTNSTSGDPVEKDETPFGVSVGSGSSSRTLDQEAGLGAHLHVGSGQSTEISRVWPELNQPPSQP